jgi:hypothetical protein
MTDTPPMLPKPTVHGTGAAFVWVALAVAVFAGVLLFFFNPAETRFYPRCMMKAVSGLDCPGCGGLRATHQLLHGNVREAFALNPLFIGALPLVAFWAGRLAWRRWRGQPTPFPGLSTTALWWAAGVVIAFGVLRNLPWRAWFGA